HRCAEDEDVRGKELLERVAATHVCDPYCAFRRIRRSDGREALAVKVRDRIGVEVTPDHFETWDCRFQRSDQRCRELARSPTLRQNGSSRKRIYEKVRQMRIRFDGKTVVVSGAGHGFG